MKIFFDTEFIEDGKTIDLISIGMIREDSKTYYAVSTEFDESKANDWVKQNVLPKLNRFIFFHNPIRKSRKEIANEILEFAGDSPEFWAYFADYDWVVLCQLFGRMVDLPGNWPMFCLDLKQKMFELGNPPVNKLTEKESHNALTDAMWVRDTYYRLEEYKHEKQ